ncbi:MAG: polysaccharide biosynthesis/export family protein [Terracidiphilus sp.]
MKCLSNLPLKSCLLASAAFSMALWGQAPGSNQPDATPDPAAAAPSPAQRDPAAKGPRADDTYVIGDDDVLAINVWKEPELTRAVTVRSDGRISLPLVGEMQAAGRTPAQLEEDLKAALVGYITDPQVTVIVQAINSRKFNVLGEVTKPGSFLLNSDTTIIDAIALAGGLREFAKKKDIYIIRQGPNGAEIRIPFNYQNFIKGKKKTAQNIELKPNDTVVVP